MRMLGSIARKCKALYLSIRRLFDSKERCFRRQLKARSPDSTCKSNQAELPSRSKECVDAIRQVMKEQLDLPNVRLSDVLTDYIPDIPEEEILTDALELLGFDAAPKYRSWDGTVGDLVRILEETIQTAHGSQ